MKTYVKRITWLLSTAVLCNTLLLSGCGNTTSEKSKKIPSTSSAESEDTSAVSSSKPQSAYSSLESTASSYSSASSIISSSASVSTSSPASSSSEEKNTSSSTASYSSAYSTASSSSSSVTASKPVQSSTSSSTVSNTSSEPHFEVPEKEPLDVAATANIKICSLSEALANFSEIESKTPEGSPEEIVKTLLERNILCFAALQAKCWTFDESKYAWNYEFVNGIVPIQSEYLASTRQIDDLFYGTYTNDKADYLIHYDNGWGATDAFMSSDDGLQADFSQLLKVAEDSFKTPTYAGIISASDDEIVFGRYYDQYPVKGSPAPNNYHFKAVKENGNWRLESYITDAPAYSQQYGSLIQTKRVGAPDIVKIAMQEVGYFGGDTNWHWLGFDYRIEWCAAFVSWCYDKAGKEEPIFIDCNAGGISWFEALGQWADADYRDIAPGDCIFFDWDLNGLANHVGLVIGTDGKKVYTIEGNRSDACRALAYDLDDPHIFGYGLMNWDDV